MEQILTELKELKENQLSMQNNINELKSGVRDLKEGQSRIETKLDDL